MTSKQKRSIDTALHWAILGILMAIVLGMLGAAVRAGSALENVDQNSGNIRDMRVSLTRIENGVGKIQTDVAVITDRIDRDDQLESMKTSMVNDLGDYYEAENY